MSADRFSIVGKEVAGVLRVEAVVAEGGFGVVYSAHHTVSATRVALKCLKIPRPFDAAEIGDFVAQFRREADLLFQLSAALPAIVRPLVIDAFTAPTGEFVPFMALEWLDGDTLDKYAVRRRNRGTPVTLKRLLRILAPAARALARAHDFPAEHGRLCIVHGDLKPQNLFVCIGAAGATIKLLDYGVGTVHRLGTQVERDPDAAPGGFSPAYGAPEQWDPGAFGGVRPATDVWGLALTIVEILAGRRIIVGDAAVMRSVAMDPARRPTPRTEGVIVNDEVESVFRSALAIEPAERPSSVAEFWSGLIAATGGSGSLIRWVWDDPGRGAI